MYPVEKGIEYGDIVAMGSEMVETYDTGSNGGIDWNKVKGNITKLVKSNTTYQNTVIGIVSDNNNDFSSTGYNIKEKDNPMPIAMNGRVPVKISSSSEEIKIGDYLTSSTDVGKATKAIESGYVIGKALENWSPASGKEMVMVFVENGYHEVPIYQNLGLKILNIMDMDKPNIWRDAIIAWLGNASNKITRIFTGEICLTDESGQTECINRSELHNLKNLLSQPANTQMASPVVPTISDVPTPDVVEVPDTSSTTTTTSSSGENGTATVTPPTTEATPDASPDTEALPTAQSTETIGETITTP